jgi:microcystin-dependent protein
MAEPYIGEIRTFSFNFPPKGWAACNGQLLAISQNQALFSILGTTYGGNGITTFALPNFQGRVPVHAGNGFVLGESGGEQAHTLLANEMPAHTHVPVGSSNNAAQASPDSAFWAVTSDGSYSNAPTTILGSQAIAAVGGGQAHETMSPYLTLNFCIALTGVFPSRN